MTAMTTLVITTYRLKLFSILESILIGSSAVLLAIWAMQNTIALRNILLVFGAICALIYWYQNYRVGLLSRDRLPWFYWTPLALIGGLFLWVLLQNLFLSTDKSMQLHELTSTWLRAFLAFMLGSGTALAVGRRPKAIAWIGLGLVANFVAVFCQYLPSAIEQGKMYQTWHVLENILGGKVYGALMGTLYFGGLLGLLSDILRGGRGFKTIPLALALLLAVFILYCYVFVLDTRNGLALAILLSLTWIAIQAYNLCRGKKILNSRQLKFMIMICSGFLCAIIFFGYKQFTHNPFWANFVEDVSISRKIDEHSTWKNNPAIEPYPLAADGRAVSPSTYERVAWFVAGSSIIPSHPMGVGVLKHSFGRAIKSDYPNVKVTTSHCAWIDYALALGLPGLFLMLSPLILSFLLACSVPNQSASMVRWLVIGLTLIYSLGELFNQAAVEILIYWIAMLAVLIFPVKSSGFIAGDHP